MTSTEKLAKEIARLNPEQREAVNTIDGPVIVIAGPGTGKTQILTLRIANILMKTDTAPSSILALTFTDAATHEMRERLVRLAGPNGYYVNISTFHGFANRIIQEHPHRFPEMAGFESLAGAEQAILLRQIISEESLEHLKPFGNPFHYLGQIRQGIQHLKREIFSPMKFAEWVKEEKESVTKAPDLYHEKGAFKGQMKGTYRDRLAELARQEELAMIYGRYETELKKIGRYDWDDMILAVNRALQKDRDFRLDLEERYQYLLVDEHQDTNAAQNRLVELLTEFFPNPNLFVVGDEKQAIYRFQGASLENFLYFKNKYPSAKIISLTTNYRSPQWLLDASQKMIEKNTATLPAPLRAFAEKIETKSADKIAVRVFENTDREYAYLADAIQERLTQGVSPKDIAILYRENQEAFAISDYIAKRGIRNVIESDENILSDGSVRRFLAMLKAVDCLGENEPLAKFISLSFQDLEPLDIYRLLQMVDSKKESLWHILRQVARADQALPEWQLAEPEKIKNVYNLLTRLHSLSKKADALKVIEAAFREGGWLEAISRELAGWKDVQKVSRLYNEAKRAAAGKDEYTLHDFLEHLEILREHKVSVRLGSHANPGAVRLMTAHRAKGLEFERVFIVNLVDGLWGNRRSHGGFKLPYGTGSIVNETKANKKELGGKSDKDDSSDIEDESVKGNIPAGKEAENEDERRLFYMALTRAKREVVLSYARQSDNGKMQTPSQFISELPLELLDEFSEGEYEERPEENVLLAERAGRSEFSPADGSSAIEMKKSGPSEVEREYLQELFLKRPIAATHLNSYLLCPWKYFYVNLLRIPQTQNRHQAYGTAVHCALEKYFERKKNSDIFESGSRAKPGMTETEVGRDAQDDLDFLKNEFEQSLARSLLPIREKEAVRAYGWDFLRDYWQRYEKEWNYNVETEVNIKGVEIAPQVILSGKLDKVEALGAGSTSNEVRVTDYKTRAPKSRNDLMGKTKNGTGDEYRQLCFYRLLLENDPVHPRRMTEGVIDFVEPNERGIYKKEVFEIPDEDLEQVKSQVLQMAEEVRTLAFWDKRCDSKDSRLRSGSGEPQCEWCELRGANKE